MEYISGKEAEKTHNRHVEDLRNRLERRYSSIKTEVGYSGHGLSGKVDIVGIYEKNAGDETESIDIIEVKTSEHVKTRGRAAFELDKAKRGLGSQGFKVRKSIVYFADTETFYERRPDGKLVKSDRFEK